MTRYTQKTRKHKLWSTSDYISTWEHFIFAWEVRLASNYVVDVCFHNFLSQIEYFYPQYRLGAPADPEKFKKLEEAVEFLDGFLSSTKYVAGESITVADYSVYATFSTLKVAELDFAKFPNVTRWFDECSKNMPGVEANAAGMEVLKEFAAKLKKWS